MNIVMWFLKISLLALGGFPGKPAVPPRHKYLLSKEVEFPVHL